MTSKALILLGLFALLFVVSEVAAASEKQSGTVKSESEETVQPDVYLGGYCRHGCCATNNRFCTRCCSYAGEAVQTQPGH